MSVVRPLRRRKRRSLVVIARVYALVLVLAVLLLGAGIYAFITAPSLRAHTIVIHPATHVSATEIRAAAAIDPQANVWLLNAGAVARRIETIPYVATATVHRTPPARIELTVTERRDWGCLVVESVEAAVDEAGRVLHAGCAPALPLLRLPTAMAMRPGTFVTDERTARLIRDTERLTPIVGVRSVAFERFGSLEVSARSGVVVHFGSDDDLETKAAMIGPILTAARSHGRPVRGIDLRAPQTPVVDY